MKLVLLFGISFCALSVIMGAFGAHALKDKLSVYSMSIFNKAVLYQMFHSIGIIIAALLNQLFDSNQFNNCAWMFIIGIVIFSGSLYILSITGLKWLGAITPIGGTLFIASWILMFYYITKLDI